MAYYAIFTTLGLQRLAEAQADYEPLVFTHVVVGDGNGAEITPSVGMTELVNETARVAVNLTDTHPEQENTVRVEGLIPADTGGFTIREAGLLNAAGELIAVASYPPIYKPVPAEGVSVEEYIRILLVYEAVEAIALTTDESVVMATRHYVDSRIEYWNSNAVKILRENLSSVLSAPTNAQVTEYPSLRGHSNGTGTMAVSDPSTAYGGRFVTLGGTDGAEHSFGHTAKVVHMSDDRVVGCEFDARFAEDINQRFGLFSDSDVFGATPTRYAEFRYYPGFGVSELRVSDAAFTPTDAPNTNPAIGEWHHVKLVCFGANTPQAVTHGSAFTNLYIDGVLQAQVDRVPSGSALHFAAAGQLIGSTDSCSLGAFEVWWLDHSQPVPAPPLPLSSGTLVQELEGKAIFTDVDEVEVTFEDGWAYQEATGADGYKLKIHPPYLADGGYAGLLIWVAEKTTTGFVIRASDVFTGEVEWEAVGT